MDLDKLEAYAKHGDMGPYSTQFVELITLIRKQEAALQAATTQEIRAVASSSAPSVATVDTPELVKLMSFWADSDPGPEALEKYQAVIAHIDAHVSAQVAEERLRADNADGMAECMCMFRDDMISAGIITDSVAPMFMSEAILRVAAAKDAEIKTLTAALDAQGELTDRYQEIALSSQAAATVVAKPVDELHEFQMYKSRAGHAAPYAGDGQFEYSTDQAEYEAWLARAEIAAKPTPAQVAHFESIIIDANRYRFIRSRENSLERFNYEKAIFNGKSCYHEVGGIRELKSEEELDSAVDSARCASLSASQPSPAPVAMTDEQALAIVNAMPASDFEPTIAIGEITALFDNDEGEDEEVLDSIKEYAKIVAVRAILAAQQEAV